MNAGFALNRGSRYNYGVKGDPIMEIVMFDKTNEQYMKEAAALLFECFPHSYPMDETEQEMKKLTEPDRIAIYAQDNGHLVGYIGAIPQYGITGWELHPLMVTEKYRAKGVGTKLIQALEKECAKRGGITIYLGTDDEFGKTTLSATDLYENTYEKIESIHNIKRHPYEFYKKNGYKIVGVIPDANGIGKPDIYMAKRIID